MTTSIILHHISICIRIDGIILNSFVANEWLKIVKKSLGFSFIFSDFVFHIMFNCFPALFRGQISVLLLKFEVFISFAS